ncbi:MAG: T9SS type A sorting domain-containing protein [Saprospiraceae bacterium]|nr:T9SS type A sorting domain-containing protein [Saprospiraceae bacterium]
MKIYFSFLFIFASAFAFAQSWTQVLQWGDIGSETCSGLALDKDGSIFLAGTFQNKLPVGIKILQSRGAEDIFLIKTNLNGNVLWAKRAGSNLPDQITAITLDQNDQLICTGNFWQQADFEELILNSTANSKAIFLVKYDTGGQALWGKSINGPGLKDANDLTCDSEGNIFLTGFFADSLEILDTTLFAAGKTDLFVAKFSPDGSLLWALRQGQSGDTRGISIDLMNQGDAVIAGYFNDTTRIADTILTANTADQDLFLTRISKDGQPRWAKKAGGVFDKDVTALVVSSDDKIYLTGYLVGVMRLSNQLSIQSATGNPDFFVLKYDTNGNPLKARAFGGSLTQQAMDATLLAGNLAITGFYQGDMNFDGFRFSAGNHFNGFVAVFDSNLICQWTKNIISNSSVFPTKIASNTNQEIWIGGSFTGQAAFDNQAIQATNAFDVFLAKVSQTPTGTKETSPSDSLFMLFPNPAKDFVLIQTEIADYQAELFDSKGQSVFKGQNIKSIPLENLPEGLYLLQFQAKEIIQTQKLVITKAK